MIIILKPNSPENKIQELIDSLQSKHNIQVQRMTGVNYSILGLLGDTSLLDMEPIQEKEVVKRVMRIQEPYKKVNRAFHPEGHGGGRRRFQHRSRQAGRHGRAVQR